MRTQLWNLTAILSSDVLIPGWMSRCNDVVSPLAKNNVNGLNILQVTDFPTRIMRPSVVIGHSRTFTVANSFTGIYGFTRKLLRFKEAMSLVQQSLLNRESMQMRVDPEAWLNLIPIDLVAQQAVQIACSGSQETCFHLTNATPPTTSVFLFALFEEVGIKRPRFVESREQFSSTCFCCGHWPLRINPGFRSSACSPKGVEPLGVFFLCDGSGNADSSGFSCRND